MKKINQIRESNDILFEMEDSQMRKLSALARAGLFDPKKINFIKRALDKDVKNMTSADKKALIELLDSLIAEVLGSTQVYSKVKQEVMKEAKKDYLSKYDPRFDKNYPSESDLPQIIILKRKAIRVYPDSQKVGLYYSQALDKYVSIPFGPGLATMSEETELNELSKSTYASAAFKATAKAQNLKKQADDEKDPVKKKAIIALQQKAKNLSSKASEKIKKIETDTKKTNDAEKEARSKIYRGEVNPVVGAAALAGVGARKLFDKFRAKRAEKKSAPEPNTSKAPETKKDDTPKSTMSTSGKVSATFEPQKTTQSKVTIKPKTKEPESKSDQSSDAGYEKVLATQTSKTKTMGYQSHSAATIPNIKHGAPKKAGGVFLPPSHPSRSTSAQPSIKTKAIKSSMMKKIDEKRQEKLDEALPAIPLAIPLIAGAARLAPVAGRVAGAVGGAIAKVGRGIKNVASKVPAAAVGYAAGSAGSSSGGSGDSDSGSTTKELTPKEFSGIPVKTNRPEGKVKTALQQRDVSLNRKALQTNESVINVLRNITEEQTLNIFGNKININNNVAEKVVTLYDSLSESNRKKMDSMLSENAESFKKVITFALEQA